jgi:hypothetical protein
VTRAELKEVLSYALGGQAPERFVERLLTRQDAWDEEFAERLEALAYELRPDLAVWEFTVDDAGHLHERRIPLLESGL